MRFSESSFSRFSEDALFFPYFEEGILPLRVFKPTTKEKIFKVNLAAVNCLIDDKRTHMLTTTVPSMSAFSLWFDFTIWACRPSADGRLNVQSIYGSLVLIPAGTDPLYELISKRQLFARFENNSRVAFEHVAASVVVGPFNCVRTKTPPFKWVIICCRFSLYRPLSAPKKEVGVLIAARTYASLEQGLTATTATNNAVAQFSDTLLQLDDNKDQAILRLDRWRPLDSGRPPHGTQSELLDCLMFNPNLAIDVSDAEQDEHRLTECYISQSTHDATTSCSAFVHQLSSASHACSGLHLLWHAGQVYHDLSARGFSNFGTSPGSPCHPPATNSPHPHPHR
ncbi:hypothetical protein OSTOST_07737 [Ostertagia ostertagi]